MVAEEDEHDADSETRRSGGTRDDDDADWVREGDDDSVRAVGVNSTLATIASVVELQAQTQQTASNASGGEAGNKDKDAQASPLAAGEGDAQPQHTTNDAAEAGEQNQTLSQESRQGQDGDEAAKPS